MQELQYRGTDEFRRKARRIRLIGLLMLALVPFTGARPQADGISLKVLGHVKPKKSTEIPNSPWGIQAGAQGEDIIMKAAEIGVKWTRLQATWADIEREPGVFTWDRLDEAIAATQRNGITPFVTLNGTNTLYVQRRTNVDPKLVEVYGSQPLPPTSNPKAMEAWLQFVKKTVEHYKGTIRYWEIWNEPNHFAYWGDEPNGKEYGRLVHEGGTLIKQVDPAAVVIAGSLAGLDPPFVDDFLGSDNKNLVDIVTFHNYGNVPEERIYKAVEVWNVIKKHNPAIKLWQGECGTASHSSTSGYRGFSPWGLAIQAKWLLRQSFTDTYFCKATLSNYFYLYDRRERREAQRRDFMTPLDSVLGYPERNGFRVRAVGVNEKCLLDKATRAPKPGFYAYQNLCAVMDGRYLPVEVPHTITVKEVGVFHGIGQEDDAFPSVPLVTPYKTSAGKALLAYWLPWHPQEIIRPAVIDLTVKEIRFVHPVLVDLLNGTVYTMKQTSPGQQQTTFSDIPLADYPFVIVERDEISLAETK